MRSGLINETEPGRERGTSLVQRFLKPGSVDIS